MQASRSSGQVVTSVFRFFFPNVAVGLLILALVLLTFAIFVFGQKGPWHSLEIADLLRTIAISSLAAGVTAIIDRQIMGRELDKLIGESVRNASGVARAFTELGLVNAHARFDFVMIFREAKKGDVVRWLDTYCPRQNEFIEALTAAIDRGVRIRMLIIDPKCATARFRKEELITTVDTGPGWDAALNAFRQKMNTVAGNSGGALEIRVYSDLPCIPMYLIGREDKSRMGYFSLFLAKASADCEHIQIEDGQLLRDMQFYFDAKWERHKPKAAAPKHIS